MTSPERSHGLAIRSLACVAAVSVIVTACSSGPIVADRLGSPSGAPSAARSAASMDTVTPAPTAGPSLVASPSPTRTVASSPTPTPTLAAPASSPPAGATGWISTGSMLAPREWHVATRLGDGRVLVVGGTDGHGAFVRAAEIYDPTSGTWARAGSLRLGRYAHSATLMPDGTVLVVGGWTPDDDLRPTASTERFDPVDGAWTLGPTLREVRAGHTATVLGDGSLLVTGGAQYNAGVGDPSAGVEILPAGARAWTEGPPMLDARAGHTATLLDDGDVLVVGGFGRETDEAAPFNTTMVEAERFDPGRGVWSAIDPLADGRASHTAVLLDDGRVLVSRMGREGSAVLFVPADDVFRTTGDLIHGRFRHTSTGLSDGSVLVVGGQAYEDPAAGRFAERYDPDDGSWTVTGATAGVRIGHTATLLADGRVLVSGGADAQGELAGVAELSLPGS